MLPAGRLDRLGLESISLARAPISILSVKPVWLLIPLNEHFPYKKNTSQLLLSATCLSSNSLRLSTIRSSWESMLDVCLLAAKKGDKRRRKGGNLRTGWVQNAVVPEVSRHILSVSSRNLLLDPSLESCQCFPSIDEATLPWVATGCFKEYPDMTKSYQNYPKYGSLVKGINLTPSEGLGPWKTWHTSPERASLKTRCRDVTGRAAKKCDGISLGLHPLSAGLYKQILTWQYNASKWLDVWDWPNKNIPCHLSITFVHAISSISTHPIHRLQRPGPDAFLGLPLRQGFQHRNAPSITYWQLLLNPWVGEAGESSGII